MGEAASKIAASSEMLNSFDHASVTPEKVRALPVEDVIWVAGITEGPGSEEYEEMLDHIPPENANLRVIFMTDSVGKSIGGNVKDVTKVTLMDQVKELIQQCMFAPLWWKPRRPKHFTMRWDQPLAGLPLNEYGIQSFNMYDNPEGPVGPEISFIENTKACVLCRRKGDIHLFDKCPSCQAVYYCSEECRQNDLTFVGKTHGHEYWCSKMAEYARMADSLAEHPFTFMKGTSGSEFTPKHFRKFLESHNVYQRGLWRWECWDEEIPFPSFGELPEVDETFILEPDTSILSSKPEKPAPIEPLKSWEAYFEWRGLPLTSPVAMLLQWPLTLYHILTHHLPQDFPEHSKLLQPGRSEPLILHLVGVEKEADLLPVFWELGNLLPGVNLHIIMIGKEVSKKVDGREVCKGDLRVKIHQGLYHKYSGPRPHLVVGLNSGLAAYLSWNDTLKKVKDEGIPTYLTDYCQYSSVCAHAPMEGLHLGSTTTPQLNPFRSPVRKYCEEHDMPWYSNAFLFRLTYTQPDAQNVQQESVLISKKSKMETTAAGQKKDLVETQCESKNNGSGDANMACIEQMATSDGKAEACANSHTDSQHTVSKCDGIIAQTGTETDSTHSEHVGVSQETVNNETS